MVLYNTSTFGLFHFVSDHQKRSLEFTCFRLIDLILTCSDVVVYVDPSDMECDKTMTAREIFHN